MIIIPSEVYTFMPVLMTLTYFQGHNNVGNVNLKLYFLVYFDLIAFKFCSRYIHWLDCAQNYFHNFGVYVLDDCLNFEKKIEAVIFWIF